ncbi:MAG: hypothetical protein RR327_07470, partial [Clostridia bacterium]
ASVKCKQLPLASRYASAIKTCHKRVKGRSSLSGLGGSPIGVWGGSPENTALVGFGRKPNRGLGRTAPRTPPQESAR